MPRQRGNGPEHARARRRTQESTVRGLVAGAVAKGARSACHHPVRPSGQREDLRQRGRPTYDLTRHAKRCAARKFLTSYLGFCQLCRDSNGSDQPQHLFLFRRMSLFVKLLFRYPDVNFSNDLHVTSAHGGFPATWEPQTLFIVHQCTKPYSLALRSSLPSGCSPLQVQFWTSPV